MSYTTADLISAIKAIGSIPTNQNLFQTADFLRFANHELQINLVPMVMSTREEYFVADKDYDVTSDQASYAIPPRAIAQRLRDVQLIDSSDNVSSLAQLNPSEVSSLSNGDAGFYLKAGNVVISPTPSATVDTLRLVHFRRPNALVETSDCGQITDITGLQVTVDAAPSTFAIDVEIDFIKDNPGFECVEIDQPIASLAGNVLTFTTVPTDLAVGDWVALAGESPIPQIPAELHPILAQMVAIRCMAAQGKTTKDAKETLDEMKHAALTILSPRVEGENKKIRNPNSLLNYFRR